MTTPFLRDETNSLFIAGTLKIIKDQKIHCTLWQNVNGKRLVCQGKIFDLNLGAQVVSLNPIGGSFLFSTESDLYFQCEYKHLLFKCKVSFANKTVLMLKIPKSAKAIESRSEQRFSLLNDRHPLELSFLKFKAYESTPLEYSYRICDISNGGGSFLIMTGSLTKFHVEDKIMVKSVGQDALTQPQEAFIRNITPFVHPKFQNMGQHRVGFQFKNRIDISGFLSLKVALS